MSTVDQSVASPEDRRGPSRLYRGIGRQRAGVEPRDVLVGLNRGAILSRLQQGHQAQVSRGFYSLLGAARPAAIQAVPHHEPVASEYRVVLVDSNAVLPNRYRPQVEMDDAELDRLAQSIREQGILEPLQVLAAPETMEGGKKRYWVISGERRRQAAIRAGLRHLPVLIRDVSPKAGLQMFLSQALHTRSLSSLDRAHIYDTLTRKMYMTVEELAARVGASSEQIQRELALLALGEPSPESLRQGQLQRLPSPS